MRSILKGQALVETALIAPILIFILIGVFEVGWALRGYLVLANANREAARFAARPNYLRYDDESYMNIVNHGIAAMSEQIEFTKTGTVIISVIRVDPQLVCDPETLDACNCENASTNPFSPTLIISPLDVGTATFKYPYTSTEVSRININDKLNAKEHQIRVGEKKWLDLTLIELDRYISCQQMKSKGLLIVDNQVTVEMFYHQPQLFGFPLISTPLTDPVPLYGHSTFRIVEASRE